MTNRVVITGIGAITPLGNDLETFWENIKNNKCGIDFITRFDTTEFKAKLAAEVKDLDIEKYMPKKNLKRMDLFSVYAICAAVQAVEDSKLVIDEKNAKRVGVMVGSGIGGLWTMEEQVIKITEKGPSKINPLYIPMVISNMAAGNVAVAIGAKGICTSVTTACATSTNSIGEAFRNIKHGYSDVIIAGGSEAPITKSSVAGFTALTALCTSEDKTRASIPFDKERSGFIMGEGAGTLVLESLEHAQKRGAKIYGEIIGYGSTCDAYHMTSPTPTGEGAADAMANAIAEAGISPSDIGYINAHGTSTPVNDAAETLAIKTVFGSDTKVNISSTKSSIGHLLGAAGAAEAIITTMALKDGFIPATLGLKVPDEDCDLNYTPNVGINKEIKYALSNSLGFGGHNAVICIKKWEE